MPFNISFFKTPKHRVFHYEPRYYDERREHREMVRREALREKAVKEGREWKDDSYKPGQYISGKLQEQLHNGRRNSLSNNLTRLIGLVSVGVFLLFLYFFARNFKMFLQLL